MQPPNLAGKAQPILLSLLVWIAAIPSGTATQIFIPYPSSVTLSPHTCPQTTVNYITHSLAPQCLARSLPARPSAAEVAANSSPEPSRLKSFPTTTTIASSVPNTADTLPQPGDKGRSDPNVSGVPHLPTEAVDPEGEADSESPLGKDNFLSFEAWKKRNLDKYGQSPDQVGNPKRDASSKPWRQPINVLDSLGDDAEIDLEFSAFASEKPQIALPIHKDAADAETEGVDPSKKIPKTKSRSKEAGTTCKERFNYASFDCAATVLKTNAKASGYSAVLVENKDSYMLNECSVENKFIILELCEDILIDTIVLANFEFFSSIFRTFRVSVSDRFPVKPEKWKILGTFEARNTRDVQAFPVQNPLIWAKYVRIEFLTHYGNEFYCPISLVRVHGTTMLEDYRHDEDPSKADERDEDEDEDEDDDDQLTYSVNHEPGADITVDDNIAVQRNANSSSNDVSPEVKGSTSFPQHGSHVSTTPASENHAQSLRSANVGPFDLGQQHCLAKDGSTTSQAAMSSSVHRSEPLETPMTFLSSQSTMAADGRAEQRQQQSLTSSHTLSNRQYSGTSTDTDPPEKSPTNKTSMQSVRTSLSTKIATAQGSESSKPSTSSTQPPPSNPTIQESFFKAVQKRLQMLESNTTLSLQYIEEQSRILRDAFVKVEQRQLSKTTKFLDYLNGTVLNELRDFRQQYDQLWQSTVLELEAQREQSRREVVAMNARLGLLADELVSQKRMAILQSILVLLCIALVLFSRGAVNGYLEHPLVQNMLTRSATFKMRGSHLETPAWSPDSSRPNSLSYKAPAKGAYHLLDGHQRSVSEESQGGVDNSTVADSPPTPASSYDAQSEVDEHSASESLSQNSTGKQRRASHAVPLVPVEHQPFDDPDTPTQDMAPAGNAYDSSSPPTYHIQTSEP